jgi:L-threonylcarbamoyladenylate synthase
VNKKRIASAIESLKRGGVGVLPTDTLYGLVGQALNKSAVAKIKRLKKRSVGKPFIILISSLKDLEKFNVKLSPEGQKVLQKIWPGPVSVAVTSKLSFRLPKNKFLVELIKKTGPLVAPSANPEGLPPAKTIAEARNYFGDKIDFYLSASKKLSSQPSTLISLKKGKVLILRQGKYKLPWRQ